MRLAYVQLALGLFQADLAVKHEIEQLPEEHEERMLPGGFAGIRRLRNRGAIGGRGEGHMPRIVRLSGAVTAGVACLFLRELAGPGRHMRKTGFALLLGGALSNLYERCRKGYVVDYIRFHSPWKRLNRYVFNLSDFFILIGAVLIFLGGKGHSRR
ncbi:MAG: signal peptidase II [Eubacteriales bacterium]|nr:signal peptidase II [Eubacteriales bacterium]